MSFDKYIFLCNSKLCLDIEHQSLCLLPANPCLSPTTKTTTVWIFLLDFFSLFHKSYKRKPYNKYCFIERFYFSLHIMFLRLVHGIPFINNLFWLFICSLIDRLQACFQLLVIMNKTAITFFYKYFFVDIFSLYS